jgi:arginine decarboxylase-like protein
MPVKGRVPKPWSIADALETYGIHDWGNHYFHISDTGHVLVTPPGLEDHSIDLKALVDEVRQRGVGCHCCSAFRTFYVAASTTIRPSTGR